MSEIAPAAPVAAESAVSSEPQSTVDIVSAAAADIREAESTTEPVAGTTTTTTTAAPAAPVTEAERDELAEALGITGEGVQRWTTRVQYSKISKAYKALQAKQAETHAAALKTHTDKLSTVEAQIAQFDSLVSNPDALISALAQVNPQYQRFLKGGAPAAQPTGTPQRIETMDDLQRVIDARVAAELAPIKQEREQRQAVEAAIPRVKAQIAEAEAWPMFKELKTEIHAALKANPTFGLREAYHLVALPKLAAQRDSVRQDVLKELNQRPHSTTVTSTVSGRSVPSAEPQTTEEIVANIARNLKG